MAYQQHAFTMFLFALISLSSSVLSFFYLEKNNILNTNISIANTHDRGLRNVLQQFKPRAIIKKCLTYQRNSELFFNKNTFLLSIQTQYRCR